MDKELAHNSLILNYVLYTVLFTNGYLKVATYTMTCQNNPAVSCNSVHPLYLITSILFVLIWLGLVK